MDAKEIQSGLLQILDKADRLAGLTPSKLDDKFIEEVLQVVESPFFADAMALIYRMGVQKQKTPDYGFRKLAITVLNTPDSTAPW